MFERLEIAVKSARAELCRRCQLFAHLDLFGSPGLDHQRRPEPKQGCDQRRAVYQDRAMLYGAMRRRIALGLYSSCHSSPSRRKNSNGTLAVMQKESVNAHVFEMRRSLINPQRVRG